MMLRDSSTATSKRRRRKKKATEIPTAGESSGDDRSRNNDNCQNHDEQPPASPPAASAAAGADADPVWTDAMHSSFLNRMEAAFVHDILFRCADANNHTHQLRHQQQQQLATMSTAAEDSPRLDRYMPDSAESTRDGHEDDASPASSASPTSRIKRGRRGRNHVTRNGWTAGDILEPLSTSRPSHALRTGGATKRGGIATKGTSPSKESDDGDVDQVVPLFEMPETNYNKGAGHGNNKRRRYLSRSNRTACFCATQHARMIEKR